MNRKFIILVSLLGIMLCACSPNAPYVLDKEATIKIDVRQVSAGFIEVEFTPSTNAYYLVAIDQVVPDVDPWRYEKQFVQFTLDSAYMEYVTWRHRHLLDGTPVHQIATFKDHALQYGVTRYFAQYLTPDTDYWVYAYTVDPETNEPVSRLFITTVHTVTKSEIACKFRYRVKGTWDYVYPINPETGSIISNFPYAGATVDSVTVMNYLAEHPDIFPPTPAGFFTDSLTRLIRKRDYEARILYGVYAHNNDGYGDGTSSTVFEEGVTYYTAFAGVDGGLVEGQNGIYKFTWYPAIDTVFQPSQTLGWTQK